MTDPLSLTYRNGLKFTRRRERQRTFLKTPGKTGSVAHAAAIVDVDRTTSYTGHNTLPGCASSRKASANESLGVPRPMTRHRQNPCEISWLAAGARTATDVDSCPSDSPGNARRRRPPER